MAQFGHTKDLEKATDTIVVSYGAISCECAQWLINKKAGAREYIYLEPFNKQLPNADNIWDGNHLPLQFKLAGRFYKQKGYPKNYHPVKGSPEPARVFRYNKIEILSRYFKNPKHWGG